MFDPLAYFFNIQICHNSSPVAYWIYSVTIAWTFIVIPLMLILLRLRVLPHFVMVGWFTIVSICLLSTIRIGSELINLVATGICRLTLDEATKYHALWCHITFKTMTLINPQIQIKGCDEESWKTLENLPKRAYICLNHTSQYDPFVFVGWIPRHIIVTCRTLFKHSLTKVPIFGAVYKYCGHFPVYFKGGESFSVETDKQKAVSEQMIQFVDEQKGRLSMFPEGQLNKEPTTLQPFRYGSLKFALEHKMPIYFFVMWGPQDTWPVPAAIGGLPADISFKCVKFDIEKECGGHDAALADLADFAKKMQDQMQKAVDDLRGANNSKDEVKKTGEEKKNE